MLRHLITAQALARAAQVAYSSPLLSSALKQAQHHPPQITRLYTQLCTPKPRCIPTLPARPQRGFASVPAPKPPTDSSPSTLAAARAWLTAPGKAAQGLRQRLSNSTNTAYKHMPNGAKQWVDAAGNPAQMQRVVSLQLEAFWQRHSRKVLAVGGVLLVYMLWRTIFGMAKVFINLSDTVAASGFMVGAAGCVAFVYLYFRRYNAINPDTVYLRAMARLNTNPGVLEVMGAPVVGSELRAFIVTGGGVRFKNMAFKRRSKRVQMIFPLKGSDRRGLVSLEAKKRKGKYEFKMLAVDVPSAAGGEQRLFLEGDENIYNRGGVLNELRDPFLRVMGLQEQYEEEDDADEQRDEALEKQQAAAQAHAKSQAAPKPMDQGGGMYFWERAYHGLQRGWAAARTWVAPRTTA